jgi:hypothetical protein
MSLLFVRFVLPFLFLDPLDREGMLTVGLRQCSRSTRSFYSFYSVRLRSYILNVFRNKAKGKLLCQSEEVFSPTVIDFVNQACLVHKLNLGLN